MHDLGLAEAAAGLGAGIVATVTAAARGRFDSGAAGRIRYTDRFDDPNLPGERVTTVTLKRVSVGTEIDIVQEGVPAVIPPEACYLGWQQSLEHLARLVEPEIPE